MESFKESIEAFDKSLEIDPQDSCAWCYSGSVLNNTGNLIEALKSFEKAIQIGIKEECNLVYRNTARVLLNLERYQEAFDILDQMKSMKLKDEEEDAITLRAGALYGLGKEKEAFDIIESAICGLKNSKLLNRYAWLLYETGKYDEGTRIARRAINLEPNNPYYLDTLACNLQGIGKDQEAIEVFEKAISLAKTNIIAITWDVLAELYKRNGLHEKAESAFQKQKEPEATREGPRERNRLHVHYHH